MCPFPCLPPPIVTQTTQHPVRWKAHDKTHQNYIFFFKQKNFQKKNFKKMFFFKKKFFSEFFSKKKIFFFCHSRPIFFGFFVQKKSKKKKVEFSIELAGAQEDANWRGGVFLSAGAAGSNSCIAADEESGHCRPQPDPVLAALPRL